METMQPGVRQWNWIYSGLLVSLDKVNMALRDIRISDWMDGNCLFESTFPGFNSHATTVISDSLRICLRDFIQDITPLNFHEIFLEMLPYM